MVLLKRAVFSFFFMFFAASAFSLTQLDDGSVIGDVAADSLESDEAFDPNAELSEEGSVGEADDMVPRGFGCGKFSDDELQCHNHCLSIKNSKGKRIYNGGRCGGWLDTTCKCYK